jgi:hypothetical protein
MKDMHIAHLQRKVEEAAEDKIPHPHTVRNQYHHAH